MAKIDNTERLRKLYDDNDKALDTIRTTFKKDEVKGLEQYVAKLTDATEKLEQAEKSYDRCDSLIKKQNEHLNKLHEQLQSCNDEQKEQLLHEVELTKQNIERNKNRKDELEQLVQTRKEIHDTVVEEQSSLKISKSRLNNALKLGKAKEDELKAEQQLEYHSAKHYNEQLKRQKELQKEKEKTQKELDRLDPEDKKARTALKKKLRSLDTQLKVGDKELDSIKKGMSKKDQESIDNTYNFSREQLTNNLKDIKDEVKQGFKDSTSSLNAFGDTIVNAVAASRNFFNGIVDGTVSSISQYYGPIVASLEGVNGELKDFKSINNRLQLDIGLSSLVKQEAVLNSINNLVSQGITSDIESLGILTSIRDKTVSSFDVTNSDLRRLVRLNQQRGNLTAKQFGLADALKESFNSTFGDSSFLNGMFQSLTGTVLDAVSANANSGGTDSTAFYSVLESWLGAMYESGVDTNTVNAIAQGVNYLGSGNVQALSGNKQLQNLMLLSMDRAGLDYADILQRGLSDSNMNVLLSTIVDYLAEITSNTKENNVLQSSYANLFNMSVTDMTAIQNLSKSGYSALGMTGANALAQASNELNKVASRTSAAEQINNVIDNAKYVFGSSIAENKLSYFTYKASNLILDSLDGLNKTAQGTSNSNLMQKAVGKVFDNITGSVRLVTSLTYLGSLLPGVLGFGKGLLGSASNLLNGDGNNALAQIISQSSSGGLYDGGGTSRGGVFSLTSSGATSSNALKQFTLTGSSQASGITDTTKWENDARAASEEEDENVKILKEFEKTLMKAKDSDGYAFAVSLQGMSDGVLRSFASIFADEDAMLNTMTGKNNALEQNNTFIDYVEKNTSTTHTNNSSKKI